MKNVHFLVCQQKTSIRIFGVFSGVLMLCMFFLPLPAACSGEINPPEEKNVERKIAARVNGEPIYESQIEPGLQLQVRKFQRRGGASSIAPALLKQMKAKILNELINHELFKQASRDVKLPDMDKKIRDRLEVLKRKLGSEEKYREYLQGNNVSDQKLREIIQQQELINEYLSKQGLEKPAIPESEIRAFYDKGEGFQLEERVRVKHILLAVDNDAEPARKEEIQKNAQMLRQEILQGKDISEMAVQHSECSISKDKEGDLGYINKGYMPPEFDQIAFNMKAGELSEVIETIHGYHIIYMLDKKTAGRASYEEVRDFIEGYLQSLARPKLIAKHVQALRDTANVEIFLD